jgi:adenosylcobyric acid synthase
VSARALMILGTASHVGKSIITAGLGRIFADEGVRVAPFKAQNMSLNSAATPDGREIGRAQALQAEACRIAPSVEMNPVLIKPRSDTSSQVVLLGKVWGQVSAADYHTGRVEQLFPAVLDSYRKLASQYDVVLLEGAGSPAEINLREHDIVNLRMAHAANAACLLVGDIDRGGVFASLLGTMELLEPCDRDLIKGFLINKFRGDQALLRPGVEMIERRLGLPCVGVIPYLHDLDLDEEDGVAMEDRRTPQRIWGQTYGDETQDRRLRIGVIALPHMSNFTDFDALAAEPSVALAFLDRADDVFRADVLILPGTKQTLDDLRWLESKGFSTEIKEHYSKRRPILGICGGFQMLGRNIQDPQGIENDGVPAHEEALGLLAVQTVFDTSKTTQPVVGSLCATSFRGQTWPHANFRGYEIHVGETHRGDGVQPFARITRSADHVDSFDGAVSSDGSAFGTYVHGIFDDDLFRHSFVDFARASIGLSAAQQRASVASQRDARLNRLADHLRGSLNLDLIRTWIGLNKAVAQTETR